MRIVAYFDIPIEPIFSFRRFEPVAEHCAAPPRRENYQ